MLNPYITQTIKEIFRHSLKRDLTVFLAWVLMGIEPLLAGADSTKYNLSSNLVLGRICGDCFVQVLTSNPSI